MRRYTPSWRTRIAMWLAWHLPHELVYWCAVRVTLTGGLEAWEVKP